MNTPEDVSTETFKSSKLAEMVDPSLVRASITPILEDATEISPHKTLESLSPSSLLASKMTWIKFQRYSAMDLQGLIRKGRNCIPKMLQ